MAQSSYNTVLKYSESEDGLFEELVAIKDFPDLGGAPELLETTTLKNSNQTYINGIQSMDALQFTANYTLADYQNVSRLADKPLYFELWFGEEGNGEDGKFAWQGELSVWATGAGVNEVREMVISIAPSSDIVLKDE